MVRKYVYWVIVSTFLIFASGAIADSENENIAQSVALDWLKVVDEGRYSDSWNETAQFFKKAIKQDQWNQSLLAVREPLGRLLSRGIKSKEYKTSLPGAPDGQYVIIQFQTSFENKKAAIETITPMLDKDGKWRVSGYYIN